MNCNKVDIQWVPDEDEAESDDENPVNYPKFEITGSRRPRNCVESKSIVFDSQLKNCFKGAKAAVLMSNLRP